jgi:Spy/CpxP family protein refolding chaperone
MIMKASARTRMVGGGLLVAVFAAGGLVGAAVHQVRAAGDPPQAEGEPDRDPECRQRREPFHYLDPTSEQRTRIDAVIERRKQQMDAFWKQNGPRYQMILDSARVEFRNVLTPEQLAIYDQRRADHERRDEQERERRRQREAACAARQKEQTNGDGER